MPATQAELGRFLHDEPKITEQEKLVIQWQFRLCGSFYTALWNAIKQADEENLDRLALGFPDHVAGFRAWAYSDPYSMAEKFRKMGLAI